MLARLAGSILSGELPLPVTDGNRFHPVFG